MPPNESTTVADAAFKADDLRVLDLRTGELTAQGRRLAVETPVNVVYAPIPFAVMMTTPQDLEDFAYGFSLTEGIIESAGDIRSVNVEEAEGGLKLVISLVADKMQRHLARGRSMSGRTGCGVCGINDLASLPQAQQRPFATRMVSVAAINRALDNVVASQQLNALTHSVHAAALCAADGEILMIREDVGRHNALDKLIGAALRTDREIKDHFLLLTSRASFEMVEKAAIFGVGTVVSISAPTSLAVDRARCNGITLIAMARGGSALVFNGAENIRNDIAHETTE